MRADFNQDGKSDYEEETGPNFFRQSIYKNGSIDSSTSFNPSEMLKSIFNRNGKLVYKSLYSKSQMQQANLEVAPPKPGQAPPLWKRSEHPVGKVLLRWQWAPSCTRKGTNHALTDQVMIETIEEVKACFSRPELEARPMIREIQAKLLAVFSGLRGASGPEINCGNEENHAYFAGNASFQSGSLLDARALAYANLPPSDPKIFFHPALWKDFENDPDKISSRGRIKSILFHELLHTSGLDHQFDESVDRVYACQECCFSHLLPAGSVDKPLACRICSEAEGDIRPEELTRFYQLLNSKFLVKHIISRFSPTASEKAYRELIDATARSGVEFSIAMEEALFRRGLIKDKKYRAVDNQRKDIAELTALAEAVVKYGSGEPIEAARLFLDYTEKSKPKLMSMTFEILQSLAKSLYRDIQALPENTEQRREVLKSISSKYWIKSS